MTKIKLCEEDGYLWATALPDNVETCESGPILGPPEGLEQVAHNVLARAGIYNAIDLLGTPRRVWLKLLSEAGVPKEYVRTIIRIYQEEYFGVREDE